MAKPNSFLTLLRQALVKIIEPHPDEGEAWCISCSQNEGETLLLPADGYLVHIRNHEGETCSLDIRWPVRKRRDDG